MSAESQELSDRLGSWRRSFRTWRWQRPFWAGLLTLLGGLPIAYFPYANLTLGQLTIRMATTAGAGSLIIGLLLVVLGLTLWFQPLVRIFSGVAAILLALVSLVVSNIGGFVIGFLLALIGGALALSWAPPAPAEGADGPKGYGDSTPNDSTPNDSAGFTLQEAAAGPGADDESTNGRHRAG